MIKAFKVRTNLEVACFVDILQLRILSNMVRYGISVIKVNKNKYLMIASTIYSSLNMGNL